VEVEVRVVAEVRKAKVGRKRAEVLGVDEVPSSLNYRELSRHREGVRDLDEEPSSLNYREFLLHREEAEVP
tara:strand:+ start:993 stop:1205 length:213 start_codon:yes stop_codon:yes gene_type:complete